MITKRSPLDSDVIVAPAGQVEQVVLRCMNDPPVKMDITRPSVIPITDGCVLESAQWRVKAVVHVHETLKNAQAEPVALPRLNISWPKKIKKHVLVALKSVQQVNVPLIHVQNWDKDNGMEVQGSEVTAQSWADTMSHPYVAAGSSGMAVIICVVLLLINVYCLCCSAKMKQMSQWAGIPAMEETYPSAPQMRQAAPVAPTIINVPPPPPYAQSSNADSAQSPISVTVTQDQIAKLMGFAPRRTTRAIDMS